MFRPSVMSNFESHNNNNSLEKRNRNFTLETLQSCYVVYDHNNGYVNLYFLPSLYYSTNENKSHYKYCISFDFTKGGEYSYRVYHINYVENSWTGTTYQSGFKIVKTDLSTFIPYQLEILIKIFNHCQQLNKITITSLNFNMGYHGELYKRFYDNVKKEIVKKERMKEITRNFLRNKLNKSNTEIYELFTPNKQRELYGKNSNPMMSILSVLREMRQNRK